MLLLLLLLHRYGYTSVTFTTDLNNTLVCGTGDYSTTPSSFESFGHDYQRGKYVKEQRRSLLETESSDDVAGADLDYYSKKGYGWGWDRLVAHTGAVYVITSSLLPC